MKRWESFLAGDFTPPNFSEEDSNNSINGTSPKRSRDVIEFQALNECKLENRPGSFGAKRMKSIGDLQSCSFLDNEDNTSTKKKFSLVSNTFPGENEKSSSSAESIAEQLKLAHFLNNTLEGTSHPTSDSQDDLKERIMKCLDSALKSCVLCKLLPKLEFPPPVVSKIKPQQRSKVHCDVAFTSSIAIKLAGIINGKRETKEVATWMSSNGKDWDRLDKTSFANQIALLLLDHSSIPKEILKVDVVKGHLNFRENSLQDKKPDAERNDKKSIYNSMQKKKPARKFKMVMLRSSDPSIIDSEFSLFRKYQIEHHGDDPSTITPASFYRFLCETPFAAHSNAGTNYNDGPPCGFGCFHQQYWVDSDLVAVGVVDVLPRSLSSKYMFWDPAYAQLSLGRLASLKEIQWVQEMRHQCPSMQYYLLGYYIHNCHRMRYKAEFMPSELLDPVSFSWVAYDLVKDELEKAGPKQPPVLSQVSEARVGIRNGNDIHDNTAVDLIPRPSSNQDVFHVRIFISFGSRDRAGSTGHIITFEKLIGLRIFSLELQERLKKRIERWMEVVGPSWENMIYQL